MVPLRRWLQPSRKRSPSPRRQAPRRVWKRNFRRCRARLADYLRLVNEIPLMKRTPLRYAPALILALCPGWLRVHAADWPQFRGPNQDSTTPERIRTAWPPDGPRKLWKAPLTGGFSSFSVGGGKAFTLVARNIEGTDREVCVALDAT